MLFISKQIASVFFKLVIWRRSAGSLHFFLFLKKWNRWLNAAFSVPWYNCRIRNITGKEKPQWMKLQRKKEAAGSRRRIPCRFCRSLSASSGCMPCRSAWSALPGSGCPRWNAGWNGTLFVLSYSVCWSGQMISSCGTSILFQCFHDAIAEFHVIVVSEKQHLIA